MFSGIRKSWRPCFRYNTALMSLQQVHIKIYWSGGSVRRKRIQFFVSSWYFIHRKQFSRRPYIFTKQYVWFTQDSQRSNRNIFFISYRSWDEGKHISKTIKDFLGNHYHHSRADGVLRGYHPYGHENLSSKFSYRSICCLSHSSQPKQSFGVFWENLDKVNALYIEHNRMCIYRKLTIKMNNGYVNFLRRK